MVYRILAHTFFSSKSCVCWGGVYLTPQARTDRCYDIGAPFVQLGLPRLSSSFMSHPPPKKNWFVQRREVSKSASRCGETIPWPRRTENFCLQNENGMLPTILG